MIADFLPVLGIIIATCGAVILLIAALKLLFVCREKKRLAAMATKAKWNWKSVTNAPRKSHDPDGSKLQHIPPGKALFPDEFPVGSGVSLGKKI